MQVRRLLGVLFVALSVACTQATDGNEFGDEEPSEQSPAVTDAEEPEEAVQIQERVDVPRVVGKRLANAKDALRRADLRVSVVRKYSSKPAGAVLSQSIGAGTEVREGRTVRLVISKGPRPQPTGGGGANCTPGYSPCLPPASDYDCIGGSGDGPEYTGLVRVTGSDPYGLDADNDGYGCE